MTTIAQTVQTALDAAGYGQYVSHAAPVVAALEEREQAIADAIREAAEGADYDPDEVDQVLTQVGLPQAKVEAVQETVPNDIAGVLRRLSDQVDRLTAAARARGLSV